MAAIRSMQRKDVEEVARLEQKMFSRPWSNQGFLDALNLPNTVFFVAEEEGRIVGYCGMYLSMDEAEVTNVAVDETMRCRGIGAMLLCAMKKEAEHRSVAKIVLEVRKSNDTAIRLYERNDFHCCGVRKNFYEAPQEDAYIMIYGQ